MDYGRSLSFKLLQQDPRTEDPRPKEGKQKSQISNALRNSGPDEICCLEFLSVRVPVGEDTNRGGRRTDEQMNRRTDEQKNRRTDEQMKTRTDEQKNR